MMSLDPQFRSLRGWEQAQPCPPPVAATELQDPRRIAYIKGTESFLQANPEQMQHAKNGSSSAKDDCACATRCAVEFGSPNQAVQVMGAAKTW